MQHLPGSQVALGRRAAGTGRADGRVARRGGAVRHPRGVRILVAAASKGGHGLAQRVIGA